MYSSPFSRLIFFGLGLQDWAFWGVPGRSGAFRAVPWRAGRCETYTFDLTDAHLQVCEAPA